MRQLCFPSLTYTMIRQPEPCVIRPFIAVNRQKVAFCARTLNTFSVIKAFFNFSCRDFNTTLVMRMILSTYHPSPTPIQPTHPLRTATPVNPGPPRKEVIPLASKGLIRYYPVVTGKVARERDPPTDELKCKRSAIGSVRPP